ncbi:universal stress protein [Limnohabitans sp. Rim8]|uniref:universal stress protein n=1 Tax=Limnohabitans sp. Rim8 TaxID=1100718 RepID=UPI0026212A1A|nr:universal stress protein [Limnohabitans sp. Rim8]
MYQKIILAYDGSIESQQALLNCKDLSQWEHAKVHLLSVIPYESIAIVYESSYYNEQQEKTEESRYLKTLTEGVEQLNMAGIDATGSLLKGDPVDQLVEYAHSVSADLIMLGHKHRDNWLERWWSGSIPKALIEHSPCSVLVVIIK